ncbi:Unknown protein, partial [Striga hermonthica]
CVSYSGTFSGGSYLGGVAELMRINYGLQMYSEVVSCVQALLKVDPCNFEYILWAVFDGRERVVKMKIESSEDILELIEEQKTPNIYVELEKRVNVGIPETTQQSFTQMMASQGVFPSSLVLVVLHFPMRPHIHIKQALVHLHILDILGALMIKPRI